MSFRGALAAFFLCGGLLAAQYPRITSLDRSDPVFRQLQQDIEAAYRDEMTGAYARPGSGPHSLNLYALALGADTDLFSLAARINLPYDSLAGINDLYGKTLLAGGTELLIPSRPGLFVGEEPANDLEVLMASWRDSDAPGTMRVTLRLPGGARARRFVYFPGERLNPSERAWFLYPLYRYPLPKGRLSSGFGMRRSPITGSYSMHHGIDLAAPTGTPVMAARDGKVVAAGWDDVLGNRVVLDHGGGWSSVYGHLSAISVALNAELKSGTMLGAVGSTGLSTGPHLHFEIRSGGASQNPEKLLPRLGK